MKISENFFINLFNLVGIFSTPSQTHNLCSSASSPIYINLVSISKMWDCIPIIRSCHLKLRWAVVTGEGAAVQCQCLDRAVQAWPLGPHPDPHCTQPPSSTQNIPTVHCRQQTCSAASRSGDANMKSFCLHDAMASPKRNSVTYLLFNDEMKMNHISQQITAAI